MNVIILVPADLEHSALTRTVASNALAPRVMKETPTERAASTLTNALGPHAVETPYVQI